MNRFDQNKLITFLSPSWYFRSLHLAPCNKAGHLQSYVGIDNGDEQCMKLIIRKGWKHWSLCDVQDDAAKSTIFLENVRHNARCPDLATFKMHLNCAAHIMSWLVQTMMVPRECISSFLDHHYRQSERNRDTVSQQNKSSSVTCTGCRRRRFSPSSRLFSSRRQRSSDGVSQRSLEDWNQTQLCILPLIGLWHLIVC